MIAPLRDISVPADSTDQPTILLVEDEAALQEAAKFKLAQSGITVIAASTAEQALKFLETTRPTLLWLDILLPGINGLELLHRLRADPRFKDLPVVMVSVSAGEEKVKEAFSLGVIDYIVKSQYPIEKIVQRVREIIDTLQ